MKAYILSILGIIVAGVIIDIIIPTGSINKYIKSIYSIIVVAVLIMPLIKFIQNSNNFTVAYNEYEMQESLIGYIFENRVNSLEESIEKHLATEGYEQIDIELNYSTNNNEIVYNSCQVNLKNLLITSDNPHINKYEFIKEIVCGYTNLNIQEIYVNE